LALATGSQLSKVLGHSRPSTTERYVHLDGQDVISGTEIATQKPERKSKKGNCGPGIQPGVIGGIVPDPPQRSADREA
jgi:hypothetical protein